MYAVAEKSTVENLLRTEQFIDTLVETYLVNSNYVVLKQNTVHKLEILASIIFRQRLNY